MIMMKAMAVTTEIMAWAEAWMAPAVQAVSLESSILTI